MGVLLCAARMFAVVLAAWSISSLLGWKLWISCVLVMLWFLQLHLYLYLLHWSITWTGQILPLRTNENKVDYAQKGKRKRSEIVEAVGLLVDRHAYLEILVGGILLSLLIREKCLA